MNRKSRGGNRVGAHRHGQLHQPFEQHAVDVRIDRAGGVDQAMGRVDHVQQRAVERLRFRALEGLERKAASEQVVVGAAEARDGVLDRPRDVPRQVVRRMAAARACASPRRRGARWRGRGRARCRRPRGGGDRRPGRSRSPCTPPRCASADRRRACRPSSERAGRAASARWSATPRGAVPQTAYGGSLRPRSSLQLRACCHLLGSRTYERDPTQFEEPILQLRREIEETTAAEGDPGDCSIAELQAELTKVAHEIYSPTSRRGRRRSSPAIPQRPYTLDFIGYLFEEWTEIHGDRKFSDDPAIVAGFARFRGTPCAVIGHQKGRNTKEKIYRNFGQPRPEGFRKALRVMKLAEKFKLPDLHLHRHAGRLSRPRRRGARAGRGDRRQPARDGRAAACR